jgi:uncharacterized membrane protein
VGHFCLLAADVEARHLISPNMHVIMVHFPLGLFVFGLFLEIFSFLWKGSSVRTAGLWMIAFGGLLAVPAALSGIDAFKDVSEQTGLSESGWQMIHRHVVLASWGAGIAALLTTIGIALPSRLLKRAYVYVPLLIGMLAGASLMGIGSHFGGEGVYLRGVAVNLKGEKNEVKEGERHLAADFEWFVPARSTHVVLAGFGIAIALGALGASVRILASHGAVDDDLQAEEELRALTSPDRPMVPDDMTMARTLNRDTALVIPRLPSARFWLLSSLVFVLTLVFGVWLLLSKESDFLDRGTPTASTIYKEVIETAQATKPLADNRRGAHVVVGAVLVLFPLVLALAVRLGPRKPWLVGTLCVLMFLFVAAEVWLGILLLHDKSEGPLYRFTPPEQAMVPRAVA